MQYDDLAALTPVVRREVLSSELARCVRALPGMSANDVDALLHLSLGDLVRGLHELAALVAQVSVAQSALLPDADADARTIDARGAPDLAPSHVPLASAPEQPSTPVSLFAPLAPAPRTAVARGVAPRCVGRPCERAPAAHGRRRASRA
jgi:polyadenylate-binding protein